MTMVRDPRAITRSNTLHKNSYILRAIMCRHRSIAASAVACAKLTERTYQAYVKQPLVLDDGGLVNIARRKPSHANRPQRWDATRAKHLDHNTQLNAQLNASKDFEPGAIAMRCIVCCGALCCSRHSRCT